MDGEAIRRRAVARTEELPAAYPQIAPGYHMNKKHWITLNPGEQLHPALDPALVDDLVTDAYVLMLERNVPKSQWPVDAATFGRG